VPKKRPGKQAFPCARSRYLPTSHISPSYGRQWLETMFTSNTDPKPTLKIRKLSRLKIRQSSPRPRSSRTIRFGAEPDCRDNGKHDEKCQDDELSEFEGRLGLGGGHRLQSWHFLKGLHDPDEDIKIEGDHGANDIDLAPTAGQSAVVARVNRNSQDNQGYMMPTACDGMK
jgi:hypothetical protein